MYEYDQIRSNHIDKFRKDIENIKIIYKFKKRIRKYKTQSKIRK